jgi:hypothetical protein
MPQERNGVKIIAFEKNTDLKDMAANCASIPTNLIYTEDEQYLTDDSTASHIMIENKQILYTTN